MATAAFVTHLLDLIAPPACLGCEQPIAPGDRARLVCRRCRTRLRPLPAPLCERCGASRLATGRVEGRLCPECRDWPAFLWSCRSACLMHPPADRLIHQIKYRGWPALAEPIAEHLLKVQLPAAVVDEARLCVPVPTTAARRRARGYNQAELIARGFAHRTERRHLDALTRDAAPSSQTTLQPASRGANVAGAFRVHPAAAPDLRDAHVLLIDDVITTGATVAECAAALVEAGARCVSALSFARALDARRLTET
jgi:ComF family protein